MFQFTQPKRAATQCQSVSPSYRQVSIHAAQAGCDKDLLRYQQTQASFNSRSPSGLRLDTTPRGIAPFSFNSRSPSGLRRPFSSLNSRPCCVSIHAAQAGCDFACRICTTSTVCFNSRSPSGLRPLELLPPLKACSCFNSRSPSGLRPPLRRLLLDQRLCFNSRSPSGLRRFKDGEVVLLSTFVSIHAAQAGCDSVQCP